MIGYNILQEELKEYVLDNESFLRLFKGSSFLVSGAGGLIGSYLVCLIIEANKHLGLGIRVAAVDRNGDLLKRLSEGYDSLVTCHELDVCNDSMPDGRYDYIVHAASNTSPLDYAKRPIDTIWTNVYGAKVLMDMAVKRHARRFLFCSSVEAYGRNNGDTDKFTESYSGYIDSNTLRAGYPASKRCVEALCNAYAEEYTDFDFVIARIGRFYGPTVIPGDTKAPSQFIGNAVMGEDIVLKSDGTQLFSWGYVGDCVTALLVLLAKGEKGGAYNVADSESCSTLKEFARYAADAAGVRQIFAQLSQVEGAAYSKITKATMDTCKIEALGWRAVHHLSDGISRTIRYIHKSQQTCHNPKESNICLS